MLKLVQKLLHQIDLPAARMHRTYEIHSPWVLYTFMRSDLAGILCKGKIKMLCAFCGESKYVYIKRRQMLFPKWYNPTGRSMPAREAFLVRHHHRNEDTWNKLLWKYPLANAVNVPRRGARDEGQVN